MNHQLNKGPRMWQQTEHHKMDMPLVGVIQENALKNAVFYVQYKDMTLRQAGPEEITLKSLEPVSEFKILIDEMKNPSLNEAPKLTTKRAFEFFDEFKVFLNKNIGTISKRPLGYIIQKSVNIQDSEDEPPFGEPDLPFTSYFHKIQERAPICIIQNGITVYNTKFQKDNHTIWKLLYGTIKYTQHITHIKKFQKEQDGWRAYFALYKNLRGTEAIQNRINTAENRLQGLSWDGKVKKGWNFDKHVLAHKEQHIILEKLTNFGYARIDEGSKIRHFIQGNTDPSLTPVTASLSTTKGNKTFDSVVESCKTFITQQQLHSKSCIRKVNVAVMSASTGIQVKDKLKKINATEDKYDPKADYSAFEVPHQFYKTANSKEDNAISSVKTHYINLLGRVIRS